jgi:hypothetical protein
VSVCPFQDSLNCQQPREGTTISRAAGEPSPSGSPAPALRSSPSRPLGDPGRVQGPGPVPRLRAERTWYTPRVKRLAQEPLAWLATAELIGVVCWLRPAELVSVVRWFRPAELIGIACWLRPAELISVACWLRPAELIGIVRWLRPAEPVADFRSARAVRTCHLDLHHRYLRQP